MALVTAYTNTPILEFAGETHTNRHADNRPPNPEDEHMKGVFDQEIRGKTDRYVLRFRKPE